MAEYNRDTTFITSLIYVWGFYENGVAPQNDNASEKFGTHGTLCLPELSARSRALLCAGSQTNVMNVLITTQERASKKI